MKVWSKIKLYSDVNFNFCLQQAVWTSDNSKCQDVDGWTDGRKSVFGGLACSKVCRRICLTVFFGKKIKEIVEKFLKN